MVEQQQHVSSQDDVPSLTGASHSADVKLGIDKSWWDNQLLRLVGASRAGAHVLTVISGIGVGVKQSSFRTAAGAAGLGLASIMSIYGTKNPERTLGPAHSHDNWFTKASHPELYPVESASAVGVVAGLLLAMSGVKQNHPTEAISGVWTAMGFALKGFAPENGVPHPKIKGAPELHGPGRSKKVGFTGQINDYIDNRTHNPSALGTDMLKISSGLILFDAVTRRDQVRFMAGLLNGVSNLMFSHVRRADYHRPAENER